MTTRHEIIEAMARAAGPFPSSMLASAGPPPARIRGISYTDERGLPRGEPVIVCDSRVLTKALLMAWGGRVYG